MWDPGGRSQEVPRPGAGPARLAGLACPGGSPPSGWPRLEGTSCGRAQPSCKRVLSHQGEEACGWPRKGCPGLARSPAHSLGPSPRAAATLPPSALGNATAPMCQAGAGVMTSVPRG